jgi:hypothetical protein
MCRACRDCGGAISLEGVGYEGSFAHRVSGVQRSHVVQQNRLFARREYAVVSSKMVDRADFGGSYSVDKDILRKLAERLGPLHARQRLGIEADHEAPIIAVCAKNASSQAISARAVARPLIALR